MSPGLYYQMVGRGFRLCEGKKDCLVLDFGGNIMRHGPVDALRIKARECDTGEAPAKECPQCNAVIAAGYTICPDCGYEFPKPEREKHDAKASEAGILSGQVTVADYEVLEVTYSIHHKRNGSPRADNIEAAFTAPPTMRVDYRIGFRRWQSEWVCFEHTGYARHKAEAWWRQRSAVFPVPTNVEEAVHLAEHGALCETTKITVRHITGEKYDCIANYELGEKPDYREPGWDQVEPLIESEPVTEEAPF
jgi:DNA repair protein RadD